MKPHELRIWLLERQVDHYRHVADLHTTRAAALEERVRVERARAAADVLKGW